MQQVRVTRVRVAFCLVVVSVSLASLTTTAQSQLDLVIRGGDVIDGSGSPARRVDVGIRGDAIV